MSFERLQMRNDFLITVPYLLNVKHANEAANEPRELTKNYMAIVYAYGYYSSR